MFYYGNLYQLQFGVLQGQVGMAICLGSERIFQYSYRELAYFPYAQINLVIYFCLTGPNLFGW